MKKAKHVNRAAATRLALISAAAASVSAYLVNGHDLLRSGLFGFITLAAAWYGAKVIYAKPASTVARG